MQLHLNDLNRDYLIHIHTYVKSLLDITPSEQPYTKSNLCAVCQETTSKEKYSHKSNLLDGEKMARTLNYPICSRACKTHLLYLVQIDKYKKYEEGYYELLNIEIPFDLIESENILLLRERVNALRENKFDTETQDLREFIKLHERLQTEDALDIEQESLTKKRMETLWYTEMQRKQARADELTMFSDTLTEPQIPSPTDKANHSMDNPLQMPEQRLEDVNSNISGSNISPTPVTYNKLARMASKGYDESFMHKDITPVKPFPSESFENTTYTSDVEHDKKHSRTPKTWRKCLGYLTNKKKITEKSTPSLHRIKPPSIYTKIRMLFGFLFGDKGERN